MKINRIIFLLIMTIILKSCSTQRVSTIVGCDYNEKQNQTDYFVLPFGSVSLPGKWEKSSYNSSSRQQFFLNRDSITTAIAFGQCNNFEFNSDRSKVGYGFVKSYYNWEKQYFSENLGLEVNLIEADSLKNIIIFNVRGIYNTDKIDNVLLFGETNCKVSSFSVLETPKWTMELMVDFLKDIYFHKKYTTKI
ncbi:MAG: hypothetical protein HGB12_16030 [Bacteroidetes bacterium]|nr:hypothetical protein [Bacteroidota bacterium]